VVVKVGVVVRVEMVVIVKTNFYHYNYYNQLQVTGLVTNGRKNGLTY
jgi:hypothetical protein